MCAEYLAVEKNWVWQYNNKNYIHNRLWTKKPNYKTQQQQQNMQATPTPTPTIPVIPKQYRQAWKNSVETCLYCIQ